MNTQNCNQQPQAREQSALASCGGSAATLKHQIASLTKQLRIVKKMERTERVVKTRWGMTIYNLRRTRLMSCSEVAVKAGLSKGAITMMETGKRPNPSLDGIIRIAAAFGISASELLKRYEKTSPPNDELKNAAPKASG